MKTYSAKPGEIEREWFVVDADGQTLGRLATRIADMLRGKGKPQYTPHVDTGEGNAPEEQACGGPPYEAEDLRGPSIRTPHRRHHAPSSRPRSLFCVLAGCSHGSPEPAG